MARTLVTFHAHPDDESLLTAGTMAKAAAEGHRVVLVVATRGEVGEVSAEFLAEEDLGAIRTDELRRSADALGVARIEWLGYQDSGSDRTLHAARGSFAAAELDEAAARLAAILDEEDAEVLTTYDPNGGYGHPDHVMVHEVGRKAAELAGTPTLLEATINRDLMRTGLELAASLGYEIPPEFAPDTSAGEADDALRDAAFTDWYSAAGELTHVIDVSAFLEAKRQSMAAHASQTTSAAGGSRTLGAFLSLPEEYFALAFATEWFVERNRRPGPIATDVFAPAGRHA